MYHDAYVESKRLESEKIKKQENYIFREQEYRKVIQGMKEEISKIS